MFGAKKLKFSRSSEGLKREFDQISLQYEGLKREVEKKVWLKYEDFKWRNLAPMQESCSYAKHVSKILTWVKNSPYKPSIEKNFSTFLLQKFILKQDNVIVSIQTFI